MKRNQLLYLAILTFFSFNINAQQTIQCGTDEALLNNPQLQEKLKEIEKDYQKKKLTSNVIPDMTTVYTIPVVFHVYHLGEAIGTDSNVSDAAIQATVARLNTVFRATDIHSGLTPDIKIQFILASFTPNCQSTNGIVRVDGRVISGYEGNVITISDNAMHESLRTLSTWDESQYINIRILHNTNGWGWAYYLGDIYMQASSVSTLSNAPGLDNFWAHEMGHSLNLYHTFEGDGGGANCPVNNNPETDGDRISDTDPHKINDGCDYNAINQCTGNIFGDVLKNIMSYSCKEKFTPKQTERMRYALLTYRLKLINSKGITGFAQQPIANSNTRCSPGSVQLTASGCNGVYNWYSASNGGNSLATGSVFNTPSLNTSTTYYVSCTETNCGSSLRTPAQVIINSIITSNACQVAATNGLSIYYGISSFNIGTISFSGSSSSNLGTNYKNNTCTIADLQEEGTYAFNLAGTYGNWMFGKIFIDYNNDGDFDDEGEIAFSSSGWAASHSGNITIPNTSVKNTYLIMRVIMDVDGYTTSCNLPGESGYGSGLAVDFAVRIVEECPQNLNLNTSNILAQEYKSSNEIKANQNFPAGVILNAKNKVLLEEGFQVGSNEVFEAKIAGGCDN